MKKFLKSKWSVVTIIIFLLLTHKLIYNFIMFGSINGCAYRFETLQLPEEIVGKTLVLATTTLADVIDETKLNVINKTNDTINCGRIPEILTGHLLTQNPNPMTFSSTSNLVTFQTGKKFIATNLYHETTHGLSQIDSGNDMGFILILQDNDKKTYWINPYLLGKYYDNLPMTYLNNNGKETLLTNELFYEISKKLSAPSI